MLREPLTTYIKRIKSICTVGCGLAVVQDVEDRIDILAVGLAHLRVQQLTVFHPT